MAVVGYPGETVLRRSGEQAFELIEEGSLAWEDLLPGLEQREPGGSVHLGERGLPAGMGRVLHREGVAPGRLGVAVAFDRPGVDDLAAGLLDRFERAELSLDSEARFFLEFPPGGIQRGFVRKFAFGNRPRAEVFASPEGTAGMDEEHLDLSLSYPVHQQSGALSGRHSHSRNGIRR